MKAAKYSAGIPSTGYEHDRDDVGVCHPVSASVELQTDLIEVINIWQNLPDSMRAGILAMVKAASTNGQTR